MTSIPDIEFRDADRTVLLKGQPAIKRNIGVRYASGNLIAFFDDDVEVDSYCLYEMQKVMNQDQNTGMVYGKLRNMQFRTKFDEAGSFLTWTGFLYSRCESGIEDKGQFDTVCSILAGKSASCMIRRKVFGEVGMFDASYGILGEETDLAWRVWLRGYQVLYVPSSVAYHAFMTSFKPMSFYTSERIYYNGCRNYLSMLLTNLGNFSIVLVAFNFAVWFLASVSFLLTGKFEAAKYIMKALIFIFRNAKAIAIKRKQVQSHRVISDRELFRYIFRNPPFSYYLKRFTRYIHLGLHG
ncbi:glycosyltransferase [Patescibacteria group bacterium]|nr:glycosyltransferase [Patescibacteria group bacterium]